MKKSFSFNGSTYKWFTFKQLGVCRKFQRSLDKQHVNRITRVYHPDLFDAPLVCILPDGSKHVANGQHSLEVYQRMNPNATGLYCRVTTLDPDTAFNLKNTNNKAVTNNLTFWVSYGYGRPTELAIERICNSHGITLQRKGSAKMGHTLAVARLREFYLSLGEELFTKCIKLLTQCFRVHGQKNVVQSSALRSNFLRGWFDFVAKQPPRTTGRIKRGIADSRLSSGDILDMAKISKSSSTRHTLIANILCDLCR